MHLAAFVVVGQVLLYDGGNGLVVHDNRSVPIILIVLDSIDNQFDGVEQFAGVAAGDAHEGGVLAQVDGDAVAGVVANGGGDEPAHVLLVEFLEDVYLAAAEECGDDLEGGVLGGGADEGDGAAFDGAEERVLLGFVEAVDFVDEEDGALFLLRLVDDVAHLLHPTADGAQGVERSLQGVRDDGGEGGLADAGRPPENHGGYVAALDEGAQRRIGPNEVLLPDVLVEVLRPQEFCQWGHGYTISMASP